MIQSRERIINHIDPFQTARKKKVEKKRKKSPSIDRYVRQEDTHRHEKYSIIEFARSKARWSVTGRATARIYLRPSCYADRKPGCRAFEIARAPIFDPFRKNMARLCALSRKPVASGPASLSGFASFERSRAWKRKPRQLGRVFDRPRAFIKTQCSIRLKK